MALTRNDLVRLAVTMKTYFATLSVSEFCFGTTKLLGARLLRVRSKPLIFPARRRDRGVSRIPCLLHIKGRMSIHLSLPLSTISLYETCIVMAPLHLPSCVTGRFRASAHSKKRKQVLSGKVDRPPKFRFSFSHTVQPFRTIIHSSGLRSWKRILQPSVNRTKPD